MILPVQDVTLCAEFCSGKMPKTGRARCPDQRNPVMSTTHLFVVAGVLPATTNILAPYLKCAKCAVAGTRPATAPVGDQTIQRRSKPVIISLRGRLHPRGRAR